MGPGNRAQMEGQMVDPVGTRSQARVTRDSWSTPRVSDTDLRPSELLVNAARPRGQSPVAQEKWSTTWALGQRPESPRTPGRQRGTSYQGPSGPGQLVTPRDIGLAPEAPRIAGRMRAQGSGPESPGTAVLPGVLGPKHETPGTAGRPRGPSDPAPGPPGQLDVPSCPRTWARVTQDSG